MQAAHFICPRCSRHLRSDHPVAAGKRMRCPSCGTRFRSPLADGPAPPHSGHGILAAWLFFAGAILLAGGGLGLAVFVNHGPQPHPTNPEVTANADAPIVHAPQQEASELPPPVKPSPARSPEPSIDPPPPPTPSADAAKKSPPPDVPPPLPAPPPPAPRGADATPLAPRPKKEPPKPEKPQPPRAVRADPPQVHWLPADTQKRVDRTIDRGVEFLRRQQHLDGSWGHLTGKASARFTPGVTALAGLTLLECGVPPRDPQVQLAAKNLRKRMPELTTTYAISVAILLFDRLGEPGDVPRLRTLAMRLIAGQKPSGGWDYYCPTLGEDEELGLLAQLYKDRPTTPLGLFQTDRNDPPAPGLTEKRAEPMPEGGLYKPKPSPIPPLDLFIAVEPGTADRPAPRPPADTPPPAPKPEKKETLVADKPLSPPQKAGEKETLPPPKPTLPGDPRRLSEKALAAAAKLPETLRKTPALNSGTLLQGPPDLNEPRTDNSNTQFAILGLLTAENHDVPIERTIALIDWRFRSSMTEQFGWNYQPKWPTSMAMTASALMGLALKHGVLLPNPRDRGRNVTVRDPLIQRGFGTLDHMLEFALDSIDTRRVKLEKLDLYALWTVERVAVLYNRRRLGSLEWYPEGVRLLLPLQQGDGSWAPGGTKALDEPSVSTSFALLFLKRSNLALDLTQRLNRADAD